MSKKRLSRRDVVADELAEADLGDRRRTARGKAVADRIAAVPDASLPVAIKDRAMLEAMYRHLSSEGVDYEAILESHLVRSGRRAAAAATDVYVAHDTTGCTFSGEGERDGVGVVNGDKQGFFAHVSLAVAVDGHRTPLGLLAAEIFTRDGARDIEGSEGERRNRGVAAAAARAGASNRLVHVADREGDAYGLLCALAENDRRLERQLESFRSLTNLLGFSLIIAYAILLMRALARGATDLPADAPLSSDQLVCLGVMTKRGKKALATASQVLDAVAELGVHLKSNGPPGWRVLSRGWQRLLEFESAYQAMKGAGLVINR